MYLFLLCAFLFCFVKVRLSLCTPAQPGTYCGVQAGLKLASALPQLSSIGITGVCHQAWPHFVLSWILMFPKQWFPYPSSDWCPAGCIKVIQGTFQTPRFCLQRKSRLKVGASISVVCIFRCVGWVIVIKSKVLRWKWWIPRWSLAPRILIVYTLFIDTVD